jgi:hypothetical protein
MIDTIFNILTWSLITAGVMMIAMLFGLAFFFIVEKMNER